MAMMTKERPPLKYRHELKHQITRSEDLVVSHRLRKLFPHDRYAGPDGSYRITSLYFDTPTDKALRQKIDGVDRREKFRLRHYNGNVDFIRLEKKMKLNGLCVKRSAKITREQVEALLRSDIGFLLDTADPLLMELYSKMRGQLLAPRTIVTYDREAFTYHPGNVRVTIDRNLRTGLDPAGFLDPDLYHIPVSDGLAVLEVKYDAFLPELVKMAVQVPNRQASANSKYAICRRYS